MPQNHSLMKLYSKARKVIANAALFSIALIIADQQLPALTNMSPLDNFLMPRLKKPSKLIRHYHTFKYGNESDSQNIQAFSLSSISMTQLVEAHLRMNGMHNAIAVRQISSQTTGAVASAHFEFMINDTAICDHQLFTINQKDLGPSFMGSIPDIDDTTYVPPREEWIDVAEAINILANEKNIATTQIKPNEKRRCYFLQGNEFVSAWDLSFSNAGKAYRAYIGPTKTLKLFNYSFHTAATATVFKTNPADGAAEETALPDLDSSGFLNSAHFTTNTLPNARAKDATFTYTYTEGDPRFDEVNVFYHANQAFEWFSNLSYSWHTKDPITIYLKVGHTEGDVETNNAYYQPFGPSGTTGPMIYVGPGDGSMLQNLTLDTDVVTHEFGHHIIFQNLKDTSNEESVTIHEGLADFFAFAKSGDTCLGESICPVGSPYCMVPDKCLRTGSNTLKYMSQDFNSFSGKPHLKGQLISAFLWDMAESKKIPLDKLAKLVYKSVSFLPESSYLNDLMFALFSADKEINGGANACIISDAAKARGMETLIKDFDCSSFGGLDNLLSANSPGNKPTTVTDTEKTSGGDDKKRSQDGGFCGVLSINENKSDSQEESSLPTLIMWLLPLGALALRSRKSHQPNA